MELRIFDLVSWLDLDRLAGTTIVDSPFCAPGTSSTPAQHSVSTLEARRGGPAAPFAPFAGAGVRRRVSPHPPGGEAAPRPE
jgi:hypothetical protein